MKFDNDLPQDFKITGNIIIGPDDGVQIGPDARGEISFNVFLRPHGSWWSRLTGFAGAMRHVFRAYFPAA